MQKHEYPALYISASDASANAQNSYFNLLKYEYGCLVVAAILSIGFSTTALYHSGYAFVFLLPIGLLIYRSSSKPEQAWYKCRALAESIKTSTWRYIMRAEPFQDTATLTIPRSKFRDLLAHILIVNKHIGDRIENLTHGNEQISEKMSELRGLSLEERKKIYLEKRIKEQGFWYSKKVKDNKRNHRIWMSVCLIVYVLAIGSVLMRIVFPDWKYWPTEPLIVIASSILGWMQIKKFNELAASYSLTAHEIGIIQGKISDVVDEAGFSDFVNEAELAFSREHTQWVAR